MRERKIGWYLATVELLNSINILITQNTTCTAFLELLITKNVSFEYDTSMRGIYHLQKWFFKYIFVSYNDLEH